MRDLTAEEWAEIRAAWALPAARWMPGMLSDGDYRCTVASEEGAGGVKDDDWYPKRWGLEPGGTDPWAHDDMLPDVRDPATVGCMLALFGAESVRWTPAAGVLAVWWPGEEGPREYAAPCKGLALCRAAIARGRWGADA